MEYNINDYLLNLIREAPSLDIAIAEFKRSIMDDDELKTAYRQWCDVEGYSERKGYAEFFQEYLDGRNEAWDSLNDYENEE